MNIDVDVDDYLDEASESTLIEEIRRRYKISVKTDIKETLQGASKFEKLTKIEQVKDILNLKQYATKAEIIREIEEL